MADDNVVDLDKRRESKRTTGGESDENASRGRGTNGGNGEGPSSSNERLASIEAELRHHATREDMALGRERMARLETRIADRETAQTRWFAAIMIGIILGLIRAFWPG